MSSTGVVFWVRSHTKHVPAHIVAHWNGRRVKTICGHTPAAGGELLSLAQAKDLATHVCVGCTRRVYGSPR